MKRKVSSDGRISLLLETVSTLLFCMVYPIVRNHGIGPELNRRRSAVKDPKRLTLKRNWTPYKEGPRSFLRADHDIRGAAGTPFRLT